MYTMSMKKGDNIRKLQGMWPKHTLAPIKWLTSQGYSFSLIQKYVSSGWLERKAHGIVMHSNDTVDWTGVVWGLQKIESVLVGGKTALSLLGKGHYLAQGQIEVYLFMKTGDTAPKWSKEISNEFGLTFIFSNLFAHDVCVQNFDFGDYSLAISNPARAMCEYLYLMEKYHTAEEAYYLMENLNSLSPRIVQSALESCNSIKVKRLFLCLAKHLQPNWYVNLDLSRINLGKGKRHLNMDVVFDSEYEIAYPKAWNKKNEDESIF